MKLSILGSSSSGNGYLLHNDNECLIIEAGVPFSEAKKVINYKTGIISGLVLTHEHGDHAKHILQYAKEGISCFGTSGTIEKFNHHRISSIENLKWFQVGNFRIKAFDIKHDAADPVGFIIEHEECGRVLFLTDTHYCEYTFEGLNNIIIEANYSEEILNKRVYSGESNIALRNRIIQSHMSIETATNLLLANDLTKVNNIVLIHLSDSNSSETEFENQITKSIGKPVIIASKNKSIEFNKSAF